MNFARAISRLLHQLRWPFGVPRPLTRFRFMPDYLERTQTLLESLGATPPSRRWSLPFPIGVFGTLREGFRNNTLMYQGRVGAWRRAFLPHFIAREIELVFRKDAGAPFEIFFYEPQEWERIIDSLDELESFLPSPVDTNRYHRTLAYLRLLPEDFDHPLCRSTDLSGERDLKIDPAMWAQYQQLPCWIYSSVPQNRYAIALTDSPIIWDGVARI